MSTIFCIYPKLRADKFSFKKGYPIWFKYARKGERPAYRDSGVYLKDPSHWNDKIKMVIDGPYPKLKNQALEKALEEANERVLKAQLKGTYNLKKAFKGKILNDFEKYIKKHGGEHVEGAIKAIKGLYTTVPPIEMVTVDWLEALLDHMEVEELSQNTKKAYFTSISMVCKRAVKDGYILKSPFGPGLFEVPKKGATTPKYLVEEETTKLVNCLHNNTVLNEEQYRILVYAMLGHFAGSRFSDWGPFNVALNVRGNIIDFIPIKTFSKKTRVIHEVHEGSILAKVIEEIREIGPLNLEYPTVAYQLLQIQKKLEIKTRLTTHIFRHSFGYMCAAQGVPKAVAAALMGITTEVIEVYYHLTGEHVRKQSAILGKIKYVSPVKVEQECPSLSECESPV